MGRDFAASVRFKHAMIGFLLVMLAVLVLAPGADAATWHKQPLGTGFVYGAPPIVSNERGDVAAVVATDRVRVAVKPHDEPRFRVFDAPGSAGDAVPDVAISKSGLVVVAWDRRPEGERRVIRFDVHARPPRRSERVSLPGEEVSFSLEPAPLAISDGGTVATAWPNETFMVVARARSDRRFQEPIPIAREVGENTALTFGSDERLTMTWTYGDEDSELRSATLSPRSRAASPMTMAAFPPPRGQEFSNLNVDASATGDRVIAYGRGDGSVRAGRAEPGEQLSQFQELEPSEEQFESSDPALSVTPQGRAIAAWSSASPNTDLHSIRVALSQGGAFGPPTTIAPDGDQPAVALGRRARAVVAWPSGDGALRVLALKLGSDPAKGSPVSRDLADSNVKVSAAVGTDRFAYVLVTGPSATRIYWRRLTWP